MLAAVKWLLLAALVLALAWWIGGLPGDVTAHAGAYVVTTSTPAALLLLFLIASLFVVMLRVLGGIYRAPKNFSGWRGSKKAASGELATQRGLVALAAGDAVAAKAEAGRAKKFLGDTGLVLLLRAEAARLAGDKTEAQSLFQQLAQHKELGFLGHRALLRASLDAANHEAAKIHVVNAEAAYPGARWTQAQRLALALHEKNFSAALGLTRVPQEISALATQAAQGTTEPRQKLHYAQTALKAQPDFAPAVAVAAQALRGLGKLRAARKMLLAGWKAAPHPLLAAAWFAPEASTLERAQDAVTLAAANPGHKESDILLGQTALEAGLPAEARRHAEAALKTGPDDGRAQGILDALEGRPVTASRSAWVCSACHHAGADWAGLCPACGKLGSLRWRAPGTALV